MIEEGKYKLEWERKVPEEKIQEHSFLFLSTTSLEKIVKEFYKKK